MAGNGDGTVGKALDVLDQVASFGRPVRFGELLDGSPFPKATLYRFVQTLTNQKMLTFDEDRQTYSPGMRLVRLAHAAWSQASLAPIARAHMDRLSADVGETVHLAQLDHAQVIYVDKRNAREPLAMYSQAGKVGPAYCTGVGKAMLAFMTPERCDPALRQQLFMEYTPATHTSEATLRTELEEIREAGIAFDREEHEIGIISIAAPILTNGGRVIGALSIATSTTRHSLESIRKFQPDILETAKQIGEDATAWQFPTVN